MNRTIRSTGRSRSDLSRLRGTIFFLFCALVCSLFSHADGATLKKIRTASWDDRFRIVLDLSDKVAPTDRIHTDPHRISIDLAHTDSKNTKGPKVNDWLVERIRLNQLKNKSAQVVFDLTRASSYNLFTLPAADGKPFRVVCDIFRPQTEPPPEPKSDWVVVIDPGHGGRDPGTIDRSGKLKEKDIVLDVSRQLKQFLNKEPGITAKLTRSGDETLRLKNRISAVAGSDGDVFVSVHVNGCEYKSARGAEVFFLSPKGATSAAARELEKLENDALPVEDTTFEEIGDLPFAVDLIQTDTILRSSHLAETILDELGRSGLAATRGIKQANFVVLRSTKMPSVLIELGFITNDKDARKLATAAHRKALARTIARGLLQYRKEYARQGH
jgi:N-acetylmuramoyl-L-alanine amidase